MHTIQTIKHISKISLIHGIFRKCKYTPNEQLRI